VRASLCAKVGLHGAAAYACASRLLVGRHLSSCEVDNSQGAGNRRDILAHAGGRFQAGLRRNDCFGDDPFSLATNRRCRGVTRTEVGTSNGMKPSDGFCGSLHRRRKLLLSAFATKRFSHPVKADCSRRTGRQTDKATLLTSPVACGSVSNSVSCFGGVGYVENPADDVSTIRMDVPASAARDTGSRSNPRLQPMLLPKDSRKGVAAFHPNGSIRR